MLRCGLDLSGIGWDPVIGFCEHTDSVKEGSCFINWVTVSCSRKSLALEADEFYAVFNIFYTDFSEWKTDRYPQLQ
jgi:hypothetical protein